MTWFALPPSRYARINRNSRFAYRLQRCFVAQNPIYDPAQEKRWPTFVGPILYGANFSGVYLHNKSNGTYVSALQSLPTAGWTIGAVYTAINGTAVDRVGFCELPGSGTFDRGFLTNGGGATGYKAKLYDGGDRSSSGIGSVTNGQKVHLVARCTDAFSLGLCLNGAFDTPFACANNGYTAYTSPEFCVGNASNGTVTDEGFHLVCYWDRALSDAEVIAWTRDPWRIFEPEEPSIYINVAAAGGATEINVGVGAYTFDGVPAGIQTNINVGVGAWTWGGVNASIQANINTGVGAYNWDGVNLSVTIPTQEVNLAVGAYTFDGVPLAVQTNLNVTPGAYNWDGVPVSIQSNVNLSVGAWTWDGVQVSIGFAVTEIDTTPGAYNWAGVSAAIQTNLNVGVGAHQWDGTHLDVVVGGAVVGGGGAVGGGIPARLRRKRRRWALPDGRHVWATEAEIREIMREIYGEEPTVERRTTPGRPRIVVRPHELPELPVVRPTYQAKLSTMPVEIAWTQVAANEEITPEIMLAKIRVQKQNKQRRRRKLALLLA